MKLIEAILGLFVGKTVRAPAQAGPDIGSTHDTASAERFKYYNTFQLKDGHRLVAELEKHEVPFEIELDDGIRDEVNRYGNGGNLASITIYIEDRYRDVLDDMVRLHFH